MIHVPRPSYNVFLGEFSGYWVGTARLHGEIVHSVQRDTQTQADFAIRHGMAKFITPRGDLNFGRHV